jgi:uncharacterized protein
MRKLVVGCGLVAGVLASSAQAPSVHVRAQEKAVAAKPKTEGRPAPAVEAPRRIDATKEVSIRQLMEATGAKDLGAQMMKSGMEQFRASVTESQPDNPRAKQFVEAFVSRFQKHFDPDSLAEKVIPIYDKYLTVEDLNGLLEYYRSPLGQRMLKVLPEIARESQETGFALGQKAAQETLEDLKSEYPDFVSPKDDDGHSATSPTEQ